MATIRLFHDTPEDRQIWDDYVARADASTSDHWWGWRRILSDSFRFESYYLGAVDRDAQGVERVTGILPLFRVPKGVFGRRCALSSIPFGNYGGICADAADTAEALLAEAGELMRRLGAEYVELHHRAPWGLSSLRRPDPAHSRFVFPLNGDMDAHMRRLGQHNRSKISRAKRWGLRAELTDDLDAVYAMYAHTARRQGTPCFPKRYFQGIAAELSPRVKLLCVMHEDKPVAFDVLIEFKRSLVGQFSGSYSHAYQYYPNEFLLWSALEYGCANGFTEFDFCRSRGSSGTASFKRKMRFVEEPLDYEYYRTDREPLPERSDVRSRYDVIIKAWQRLPLGVTQWLGPQFVRFLA